MSIAHYLPRKIMEEILDKVSLKDVYQCMFVCHSWMLHARTRLYHTLYLPCQSAGFAKFIGMVESSHAFFPLVKTIRLDQHDLIQQDVMKDYLLDQLFSSFPNLEHLDMTRINTIASLKYFLIILKASLEKFPLHSLRHIEIPPLLSFSEVIDISFIDVYNEACYAARQSLGKINIDSLHVDILQKLTEFPNLENITIYYSNKDPHYQVMEEEKNRFLLNSILDTCPQLITLNMYYSQLHLLATKSKVCSKRASLPIQQEENLSLLFNKREKTQMEFILACIPNSQLESLSIDFMLNEQIENPYTMILAHHIHRISKRLVFKMVSYYNNKFSFDKLLQLNQLLWSIIHPILGHCDKLIYLKLDCMDPFLLYEPTINQKFEIKLKERGQRIHVWQRAPLLIMTQYFFTEINNNNVTNNMSKKMMKKVSHLDLKVFPDQLIYGFEFILACFTQLVEFNLSSPFTSQLIRCSKISDRLDALHIKKICLSTKFIQKMNQSMPSIQTLWIEDCIFCKDQDNHITLDLCSMKHLQYCFFQFPELVNQYPQIMVKITTQQKIKYLRLVSTKENNEYRVFVEIDGSVWIEKEKGPELTIEIFVACLDILKLDKQYPVK